MHLFFLRHGTAEDPAAGNTDADRRLTPAGIAEMKQVAQGLRALDLRLDRIYTSPLPRAEQTARLVATALGVPDGEVVVEGRLAPGGLRLGTLQTLLEGEKPSARIMLVGHEPDLSHAAGELAGGAAIELKKAGLIRIETDRLEPGAGVLRWLLTPDHLK